MSSPSASPDSTSTRTQLRLVVLGQWVRAGLALARRARADGGVFGGAVALWQVFQAIRLAIQLIRRLSDLRDALARAARETASDLTPAQRSALWSDDPPTAACLRRALIEITRSIREALGRAPHQYAQPGPDRAASAAAEPEVPRALGRLEPPRGRPPDRPPGCRRWRALYRPGALETASTPLAAPASGRLRLAAG